MACMRVFLADDRLNIRSGLRLLLEQEPGLRIVGEAAEAEELLARVGLYCPDLVLLDWDLPGLRPADLLAALRAACCGLRVIVLGVRPEVRPDALAAGADAFVSKTDSLEVLWATLHAVNG